MTQEELRALAATWPDAAYWDCDDSREQLSHTEVLEAIEELLGNIVGNLEEQVRTLWPDSLTVYGWERKTPDVDALVSACVETFLNEWCEQQELSDPEGEGEPVGHLPEGFATVIRKDLETRHVWGCDQTVEIEIPIDQLIEIARLEWPEWFTS